jgi:cyclophilin family peptidyl-prolyl cis-trans isomerase
MQNNAKFIIGIVVVVVIVAVVYALAGMNKGEQNSQTNNDVYNTATQPVATTTGDSTGNIASSTNTNTKMKAEYKVKMETNKGVIELVLDTNIAPNTVANFLKLANSGFYNGVKFHRVIKDFMVQAGDPQSKDDKLVDMWGTGGPGYKFADEIFDPATYRNGYKRGVLAMANSGPNTNGSQFFIMHKDVALPPNYTIFGHVISGIETVDAIANVKTNTNDRPVDPVVISKIIIEE